MHHELREELKKPPKKESFILFRFIYVLDASFLLLLSFVQKKIENY